MPVPKIIPVRLLEDLHTNLVGRCSDGTQFFLNDFGVECTRVLVLYLFARDGRFKSHRIWRGDRPCDVDAARAEMVSQLKSPEYRDISVRPFSLEVDGVAFGFVVDDDDECVHLQPGSQITFMAPWDGEYYT